MTDTATVIEIVESTPIHLITSTAEGGELVSQPMTAQDHKDRDELQQLHYVASRQSTLVDNVKAGRTQVNIAVQSSEGFVSISGEASVTEDLADLKKWWSKSTDMWFDGGPEGGEAAVLTVTTDSAQFWSAESKVGTVLELIKSRFTGDKPDAGESETVNL
ncbi:MAG: pyridoxamine 5'-phosphate oxidase family protein [Actinomycetaceae bacterium]|nr:pyridoxamine 5'-phosphate oxidase family protein [Actinomycetaceae bacterium]